jgi:hypothetical protein
MVALRLQELEMQALRLHELGTMHESLTRGLGGILEASPRASAQLARFGRTSFFHVSACSVVCRQMSQSTNPRSPLPQWLPDRLDSCLRGLYVDGPSPSQGSWVAQLPPRRRQHLRGKLSPWAACAGRRRGWLGMGEGMSAAAHMDARWHGASGAEVAGGGRRRPTKYSKSPRLDPE